MTYSEAIQFLDDLQMFGVDFGLERTLKIAELATNFEFPVARAAGWRNVAGGEDHG